MSANFSNFQVDKLTGATSITAPIHYVDSTPISNVGGSLQLGDGSTTLVSCVTLNASAEVNATTSMETLTLTAPTILTDTVIPNTGGVGGSISVEGSVNLNGYGITGLETLSLNTLTLNDTLDPFSFPVSLSNAGGDVTCTGTFNATYLSSSSAITASTDITAIGVLTNTGLYTHLCRDNDSSLDVLELDKVGNSITSQTGASLSGLGVVKCASIVPTLKLQNVYYVSPSGTNSSSVNGSITAPYQTIQYAINVCEALTSADNIYRTIYVMNGSYTGDLAIAYKIAIVGTATDAYTNSVGCEVVGNIGIALSHNDGDMFNNQVNISGLQVLGHITNTSSADQCLNLVDVESYSNGGCVNHAPTSTDSRLRLIRSSFSAADSTDTTAIISVSATGLLLMETCIVQAKGVQNCLSLSGSATCQGIAYCEFTNDSTDATVPALVSLNTTGEGPYSFTSCQFVYEDGTAKTDATASGIYTNAVSGNPIIYVLSSTFILNGTSTLQFAVEDGGFGTGTASVFFYNDCSAQPSLSFGIHGVLNTNKFQMTVVS